MQEVEKNRKKTSKELRSLLTESVATSITNQALRNRIREKGLKGCTASRTTLMSNKNMKNRVAWAEQYLEQPKTFRQKVICSDESKFTPIGDDGHEKVWRRPHEEYFLKCAVPTVKHRDGSIMVWGIYGCFWSGKFGIYRCDYGSICL